MNGLGTTTSDRLQGEARAPRAGRLAPRIGFCIDVDNAVRWDRAFGSVNVPALARLLDHRGVAPNARVACGHHFRPAEAVMWAQAGFYAYASHTNADDLVAEQVHRFANGGMDQVIIATGDGRYACELVRALQTRGIEVHILARSDACSRELRQLVGANYAYLDAFVSRPSHTLH